MGRHSAPFVEVSSLDRYEMSPSGAEAGPKYTTYSCQRRGRDELEFSDEFERRSRDTDRPGQGHTCQIGCIMGLEELRDGT